MAVWLLSPLAWALVAAVLLPWAWLQRGRRWWPLVIVVLGGLGALIAMTPTGANALVAPLERSRPSSTECTRMPPDVAVVLGGGLDGWARHDADYAALNLTSRRRLDRAVAWWREQPGRSLVLQGGEPYPGSGAIGDLMRAYAIAHGMPASALRVERTSSDTWQNAVQASRMTPSLPRRVVLVTSRIHMPRARMAFEHAGLDVCPVPADSRRLPSRLPWALFPRTSALANTDAAVHEWVGLAYYRLRAGDAPNRD